MLRLACVLLLAALAFAAPAPPTPPTLALQFTSNFVLTFGNNDEDAPQPPPPVFFGFVAVDDVNYGLFANFSGEEVLPIYFHTNLVLSPSGGDATLYWFEDEICLSSPGVPSTIFQFFPLRIPRIATFEGHANVNGTACTLWGWNFTVRAFDFDAPAHITLYAAAQPQAGGTAVVRVVTRALAGEHNFMFSFDFTDTVTGPFSPTIYAPPNIHCQTIGPNPNSLFAKFTNMLLSLAMA